MIHHGPILAIEGLSKSIVAPCHRTLCFVVFNCNAEDLLIWHFDEIVHPDFIARLSIPEWSVGYPGELSRNKLFESNRIFAERFN